jgi:hypothetical protein
VTRKLSVSFVRFFRAYLPLKWENWKMAELIFITFTDGKCNTPVVAPDTRVA